MFLILSLFTQAKRGKWTEMEGCRSEGICDICMHTYTPSTHSSFLFCFSWSQRHTLFLFLFPSPSVFLMYVCTCVLTCVPASLRCQSVLEGRGALILVLMGWGGREIILKPWLWLESMVIMKKWRDTEEKNQSVVQLKVQIDCGWWLCHMAATTSVYFLQY